MTKARRVGLVAAVGVAVIGFLLFRPDTLFTEVTSAESLADAFTTATTSAPDNAPSYSPSSSSPGLGTGTTTGETAPEASVPADVPTLESTGGFVGIDHTAVGTASIYEQDGRHVLRFEEDTDIQNGPDLYVWLLPAETYEGGTPATFIDLGTLKGTVGGQNYDLPSEFDPEGSWTVLIWCLRFAVPFASAELA